MNTGRLPCRTDAAPQTKSRLSGRATCRQERQNASKTLTLNGLPLVAPTPAHHKPLEQNTQRYYSALVLHHHKTLRGKELTYCTTIQIWVFLVGHPNLKKVIKFTNTIHFFFQKSYPMVKPTWRIEGFPSYFIGDDKQLYRIVNAEKTESNSTLLNQL